MSPVRQAPAETARLTGQMRHVSLTVMPTIERWRGYRFYFCSHEPNEPRHIHVDARGCSAELWLQPDRPGA